jgi:uncharacterized Zn-binding protein involved in type VI secretion
MSGISRIGDADSNGYILIEGSTNVSVNGLFVARVGDSLINDEGDEANIIMGSPNVFANGLPIARINDSTSDSGIMIGGSFDVLANNESIATQNIVIAQKSAVYAELDPFNQPSVSRLTGAEQHDDDPGSDPIYTQYRQYAESDAGLGPASNIPLQTGTPPGPPPGTIPADCMNIYAMTSFPDSFQLSTNFTLGMVTDMTLVSNYHVQPQSGLTVQQIICNLRALCINVLEPMLAKYGLAMRINSGFRIGVGASQHYTGQAADISFTDVTTPAANFARAQDITNSFAYDQYIYEQNLTTWHHLSYNQSGTNRRQVLSKPRGSQYFSGLIEF